MIFLGHKNPKLQVQNAVFKNVPKNGSENRSCEDRISQGRTLCTFLKTNSYLPKGDVQVRIRYELRILPQWTILYYPNHKQIELVRLTSCLECGDA